MSKVKSKIRKISLVTNARRHQIEQAIAEVIAKRSSSPCKKVKLHQSKITPIYVIANKRTIR